MTDLERAAQGWYVSISVEATVTGKIKALERCLAAARREGAEAERAEWMSCANVDAMMEGPVLNGWNRSSLNRLWFRAMGEDA